ncbi:hypothetical protein Pelo_10600 [Pelomyxa schiedti]|nr:hypothetical protein Pelo_10600 [Pelomyxa schiedti]
MASMAEQVELLRSFTSSLSERLSVLEHAVSMLTHVAVSPETLSPLEPRLCALESALISRPPLFALKDLRGFDFAKYCAWPTDEAKTQGCFEAAEPGFGLPGLWVPGRDLSGCNLSGGNLPGSCFNGCVMRNSNLSRCNLGASCSMSHADLCEAKFCSSELFGTNLQYSVLSRADFSDAEFRDAFLTGAELEGACFQRCKISGVGIGGYNLPGLSGAKKVLDGIDFSWSRWTNVVIKSVEFSNCHETTFDQTCFSGPSLSILVHLEKSTFDYCQFKTCSINNASMAGSRLCGSEFRDTKLTKVILAGSDASQAAFLNCHFEDVEFKEVSLRGTDCSSSTFVRCPLGDAYIANTNFSNSRVDLSTELPFILTVTSADVFARDIYTTGVLLVELEKLSLLNSVACSFQGNLCVIKAKVEGQRFYTTVATGYGFSDSSTRAVEFVCAVVTKDLLIECVESTLDPQSIRLTGTQLNKSTISIPYPTVKTLTGINTSRNPRITSLPHEVPRRLLVVNQALSSRHVQLHQFVLWLQIIISQVIPMFVDHFPVEQKLQYFTCLLSAAPVLRFTIGNSMLREFGYKVTLTRILSCPFEERVFEWFLNKFLLEFGASCWPEIDELLFYVSKLVCPAAFSMVWQKTPQNTKFFSNLRISTLVAAYQVATLEIMKDYTPQLVMRDYPPDVNRYFTALENASLNEIVPPSQSLPFLKQSYGVHLLSDTWLFMCCRSGNSTLLGFILDELTPESIPLLAHTACHSGNIGILKTVVNRLSLREADFFSGVNENSDFRSQPPELPSDPVLMYPSLDYPPLSTACKHLSLLKWLMKHINFSRKAILYCLGICCANTDKEPALWIVSTFRISSEDLAMWVQWANINPILQWRVWLASIAPETLPSRNVKLILLLWGAGGGGAGSYSKGGLGGYVGGVVGCTNMIITVGEGGGGAFTDYHSRRMNIGGLQKYEGPWTGGKGGASGFSESNSGRQPQTIGKPGTSAGGGCGGFLFDAAGGGPMCGAGGGGASFAVDSSTGILLACAGGGGGSGSGCPSFDGAACGGGGGGCDGPSELGSGGAGCYMMEDDDYNRISSNRHSCCVGLHGNGSGGCCNYCESEDSARDHCGYDGTSGLPTMNESRGSGGGGGRGYAGGFIRGTCVTTSTSTTQCTLETNEGYTEVTILPLKKKAAFCTPPRADSRMDYDVLCVADSRPQPAHGEKINMFHSGDDGCAVLISILSGKVLAIVNSPGTYTYNIEQEYVKEIQQFS